MMATTQADGTYELPGLRDGDWFIRVRHDVYFAKEELMGTVSGGESGDVSPIVLGRAGSVRGVVITKGEPDGKARLIIKNLLNPLTKFEVSTDSQGTFQVGGVPPGDYTIAVIQRLGGVSLEDLVLSQRSDPKVHTVVAGQSLSVSL